MSFLYPYLFIIIQNWAKSKPLSNVKKSHQPIHFRLHILHLVILKSKQVFWKVSHLHRSFFSLFLLHFFRANESIHITILQVRYVCQMPLSLLFDQVFQCFSFLFQGLFFCNISETEVLIGQFTSFYHVFIGKHTILYHNFINQPFCNCFLQKIALLFMLLFRPAKAGVKQQPMRRREIQATILILEFDWLKIFSSCVFLK